MIRTAALLLCAASLTGCTWLDHETIGPAGNPSGTPYAGEPGSVFDSAGQTRPVVQEQAMAPERPLSARMPIAPSVSSSTLPPPPQTPGAPAR